MHRAKTPRKSRPKQAQIFPDIPTQIFGPMADQHDRGTKQLPPGIFLEYSGISSLLVEHWRRSQTRSTSPKTTSTGTAAECLHTTVSASRISSSYQSFNQSGCLPQPVTSPRCRASRWAFEGATEQATQPELAFTLIYRDNFLSKPFYAPRGSVTPPTWVGWYK